MLRHRKPGLPAGFGVELPFRFLKIPASVNKSSSRFQTLGIGLVLGMVTVALYLPCLKHGFVAYDDQQYVTENPQVQAGLSLKGLGWAFGYHAGNWHPLTWISHMLDCQVFGARAGGHHFTNVLLHTANTLLLFLVLRRLTQATWRSAAVAALFAWHPLHVESVAWIAERKDVLSGFFWMLTLLAYTRYAEEIRAAGSKAPRYYVVALVLFGLGLASKPMVVTLPCVLLLLDYWPLRRLKLRELPGARVLIEKVPFFALSVAGCLLTLAAQQPALVSTAGLPIPQRLAHTLLSYLHYIQVLFLPRNLAVYYPYQKEMTPWEILSAAAVLLVLSVGVVRFAARRPYLLVGWLWFLGTLVPVIGLIQVGDQAWADRYSYLPSIGLLIAVVWGVIDLAEPTLAWRRLLVSVSIGVGAAMLVATTIQLGYWKNTRTLFERAAQVTPENPLAITLLGSLLAQEGKLDAAMEHYQRALRLQPAFPEAHFFLANALEQQGKLVEAVAEYQKALWFKPTQEQTHIFLGIALAKQGRNDEAIAHYTAALKLNPDSPVAHNNLARVLHSQGRLVDAAEHYQAALALDPKLALAHNNLGILLLQQGKPGDGTLHLRAALRLNPTNSETQFNLARALNQQGHWDEAAELFARTIGNRSSDPQAHYEFAVALGHLGKTREAMAHYASALLIQPDFPNALNGLSWILATAGDEAFRNGTEAVRMAERAVELTGRNDPEMLRTLAAAYAEEGKFSEAVTTAQAARNLAERRNRAELARECLRMAEQFRLSKPWREG